MSYMVDKMPYGGYALGGYALGGEIYGGAKARAAKALKRAVKAKVPAKKLVHQGHKLKVADLKSQAKALGIKGFSKMRKAELVHALKLHDKKPHHMVEVEHKPKKQVKRSTKKTAENKDFSEILQLGDILKMKLAELKKKIKC